MDNKVMIDFSKVEVDNDVQYLRPGQYLLSIKDAKYVKPEGTKQDGSPKTPYLEITFAGKSGETTLKFYVTEKAWKRIQTLYFNWFEKKCEKMFDSLDAVGAFMELAFSSDKAKKVYKRMIIGGKQAANGKVYADLPFKYIIDDNDSTFKEGPFEEGTGLWFVYVKVENNPSTKTDNVVISGQLPTMADDFSDDLPF